MRELSRSIYLTSEEIDARIREHESQVVPPSQSLRELRQEIARLHIDGDMKHLLAMG